MNDVTLLWNSLNCSNEWGILTSNRNEMRTPGRTCLHFFPLRPGMSHEKVREPVNQSRRSSRGTRWICPQFSVFNGKMLTWAGPLHRPWPQDYLG